MPVLMRPVCGASDGEMNFAGNGNEALVNAIDLEERIAASLQPGASSAEQCRQAAPHLLRYTILAGMYFEDSSASIYNPLWLHHAPKFAAWPGKPSTLENLCFGGRVLRRSFAPLPLFDFWSILARLWSSYGNVPAPSFRWSHGLAWVQNDLNGEPSWDLVLRWAWAGSEVGKPCRPRLGAGTQIELFGRFQRDANGRQGFDVLELVSLLMNTPARARTTERVPDSSL